MSNLTIKSYLWLWDPLDVNAKKYPTNVQKNILKNFWSKMGEAITRPKINIFLIWFRISQFRQNQPIRFFFVASRNYFFWEHGSSTIFFPEIFFKNGRFLQYFDFYYPKMGRYVKYFLVGRGVSGVYRSNGTGFGIVSHSCARSILSNFFWECILKLIYHLVGESNGDNFAIQLEDLRYCRRNTDVNAA